MGCLKRFDKVSCIYKITSPSGKVYIGQAANMYLREIHYRKGHAHKQVKLFASLQKYGYDAHYIEIVELCERNKLNEREAYWIEYFDSYYNGMNLTTGGDSCKRSPETNKKVSESKKGNKNPMFGKVGELHHNFGKTASPETIKKLRNSHLGLNLGKDNPFFKGFVAAYRDGILVGVFEGIYAAAKNLGVFHNNISKVLLGKRNHTGGYTFIRECIVT